MSSIISFILWFTHMYNFQLTLFKLSFVFHPLKLLRRLCLLILLQLKICINNCKTYWYLRVSKQSRLLVVRSQYSTSNAKNNIFKSNPSKVQLRYWCNVWRFWWYCKPRRCHTQSLSMMPFEPRIEKWKGYQKPLMSL